MIFFPCLKTHVQRFGPVHLPVLFLIAVWAHRAIGPVAKFDCPFVLEFLCLRIVRVELILFAWRGTV